MKKTCLDTERQKLLAQYIDSEQEYATFQVFGQRVLSAYKFLSEASSISRRGYKEFRKNNALNVAKNEWLDRGVMHFANFIGIGYSRKQKKEARVSVDVPQKRDIRNKEILDGYILFLQNERDYSMATLRGYADSIKQFFSYFDEVNNENCRRFVSILEQEGKKPATINIRLNALTHLGEYLNKQLKIKHLKVSRKLNTDDIPTEAEYTRLCEYLKNHNPKYYFLVRVMGTTGCRMSELKQFTYEMIQEGNCTLKGKGSKYRQFFFTKEIRQLAAGKTGLIAINRYGAPISDRAIGQALKEFGDKCNIERAKMHPHAFRHFFAKMYLKKTKDVIQLADILGHENVNTTRIYLNKSQDEQQREINRVVSW